MHVQKLVIRTVGKLLLPVLVCALAMFATLATAESTAEQFADSIVRIDSTISAQGKTVARLGQARTGSAIVIDASGLLVTAGYLVLEAQSVRVTFNAGESTDAEVLANDLSTGLALLRVELPNDNAAMPIGDSGSVVEGDNAVVIPFGGTAQATVATIASIRSFAGSWEYAIERGFYTSPAHRGFSGAALVNRDAELIGIGSLLLGNITPDDSTQRGRESGNLFIPVELLTARLGSMLTDSADDSRPWLGTYLEETAEGVVIGSLAPSGPAEMAGVEAGDVVLAINSIRVQTLAELYDILWSTSTAGDTVIVTLVRKGRLKELEINSDNRWSWLVTKPK